MTHTTHTLAVAGASLHYEVRGSGPVLAVIGSPMAAGEFVPLADALAPTHTVVTYDPRGISASIVDDPGQDSTPELRADDVVAILDAVGADSADVFGSSGGAVTGLAIVARHPERVRTLVAHEPPLLELLPDADAQRAQTDEIIETFHTQGIGAAWMKFMANAGFDVIDAPPPREPSPQDVANSTRFFDHELRPTTRYIPDISALTASPARIVVGIGVDSGNLVTYRTSTALAGLLGTPPVEFPGDHGGFLGEPVKFAKRLTEALAASVSTTEISREII
jgi:pimeloyl-ACP methyl ester carboxylesterase